MNLLSRSLLALVALSALGFGVSEASAAVQKHDTARVCSSTGPCAQYCQSIYGPDALGCPTSTGGCRCLF
jgi:hypothetical protein